MDKVSQREYWKQLHAEPKAREHLRPVIRESWERSIEYGISPNKPGPPIYSESELAYHPNLNYVLDIARPIAQKMLRYLPDNYAILLISKQMTVMEVLASNNDSLDALSAKGIRFGTCLAEEAAGTNACALGIKLCKPVSVLGYEHFCEFFIDLGVAFAPFSSRKKPLGGIAIIGPSENYKEQFLGMTDVACSGVIARLSIQRWSHVVDNSISEGVLWLNTQYQVLYMSQKCYNILKYPNTDIYNIPLDSVIKRENPENNYFWSLLEGNKQIKDEAITLNINNDIVDYNMSITPFETTDDTWSGFIIIIEGIERINRLIRSYSGNRARLNFNDLIGSNPAFVKALERARFSAASFSNILLLGESGTGKDVLAQAIHNESPRSSGPFVAINCAALPKELIASELFGYTEGAFTGAKRSGNIGKFELAHQGTIFLDEIGDMPVDLQAILLRVIEEKTITRLGGNKPIPINVRIIAATHRNLEAEITRNTFRRDLYYRLGVIRIVIPSLRHRLDDIPQLSQHFINLLCKRLNLPPKTLCLAALQRLKEYHWPGNVRELQNILENAVQWSEDSTITEELIEQLLMPMSVDTRVDEEFSQEMNPEKNLILSYLKSFNYNKSKTAKALGISRKTLYVKLKEYDIPLESE